MKKRMFWLLGSLFLGLLFAACGGESNMSSMSHGISGTATLPPQTPGGDPMTESLKGLSGKDFEVKFMQEMIVHHQSAIDMAKLVPTHTKRPELQTLSTNIVTAQSKEITDLTNWLSQWHNEKPVADPMSVPGMMEMMSEMDQLKNTHDADFDKLFLTMMTTHHQQAVSMAALVSQKTQRPELGQLATNITTTQNAEIQQMKDWRQTWFPS